MNKSPAYEVHNPSFSDIALEQQIEFGINDWRADDEVGPFFGQTKDEAEFARAKYTAA